MRGWSIIQWVIAAIVLCGVIAIAWIATAAMGVPIPAWAVSMGYVVLIVIVAIACIGAIAAVWRSWFGGGPGPSP